MQENAGAGQPQEQAAKTRPHRDFSYGHQRQDRPDPLSEPYEPAPEELGLPHSQVPGHRWNGWRRLTGDEGYYAACSCGWRSTETRYVSPMLPQVQEHLDAVRAVRGWRPASGAAQEAAPAGQQTDTVPHDLRQQRARELDAAVDSQQNRLAQALERSTDLLAASQEQAGRLAAAFQHAAARVERQGAKSEASVRRAEALHRRADRATAVRDHIVAAAGTLAAIAEEIALLSQDRKGSYEKAVD